VNGNQITKKMKYIPKLIRHKLIPLNTELRTTRLVTLNAELNTTKMRPPVEATLVPKFFGTGGGGGSGWCNGAGGAGSPSTGGPSPHGGTGAGIP
jgi:hypothetical protein